MPRIIRGLSEDKKRYYENKSTKRGNFKNTCRIRGWKFDDFVETESGRMVNIEKTYFYELKIYFKARVKENEEASKEIIKKLMTAYKLKTNDVINLKTEEARFYADGMKMGLDELTDAICEVYFA